jgi:hypothetical protein
LDEAFWQQQSAFFVTPVTAVTMHQQDIILAELLPGYLVYVLLAAFGMTLVVLILCSFWRQTNPYAPVDAWLRRAQTFMRVIDRLFVLACVAIAFLLENTRGIFAWLFTDRWTELFNDGQDVLNLAALAVLAVLSIVLLVRLFGSRRYELGNSERLALFGSALICLLFIWQMPQVATLPLLNQHIQFTSNLFHWSSTALRWALLIELLAVPFLAFFWFGSQVFANYRVLFTTLFLLILCFLLLQLIWPIFLLLALICLLPGILLAMRIEKAA